jgi:hypothetical protein
VYTEGLKRELTIKRNKRKNSDIVEGTLSSTARNKEMLAVDQLNAKILVL